MNVELIAKEELRVCYNLEDGDLISISINTEGIILDLYERGEEDPISIGLTSYELVDFLKEHGIK